MAISQGEIIEIQIHVPILPLLGTQGQLVTSVVLPTIIRGQGKLIRKNRQLSTYTYIEIFQVYSLAESKIWSV